MHMLGTRAEARSGHWQIHFRPWRAAGCSWGSSCTDRWAQEQFHSSPVRAEVLIKQILPGRESREQVLSGVGLDLRTPREVCNVTQAGITDSPSETLKCSCLFLWVKTTTKIKAFIRVIISVLHWFFSSFFCYRFSPATNQTYKSGWFPMKQGYPAQQQIPNFSRGHDPS